MFDLLTDKLQSVFRRLSNRGIVTERTRRRLREVALRCSGADVNFKVVRQFINDAE
jgi:signal recognition particle GTPase